MAPFAQCVNPYWLFACLALLSFGDALCYRPSLEKRLLTEHWYRTHSPYSVRALSKVSRQGSWQSSVCPGDERGNHMGHFSLSSIASSIQLPPAICTGEVLSRRKKKIPTWKNSIVLSFLNFWWLLMLNNGLIHFFPAEINILWPVKHSCRKDVDSWSQQE